MYYQLGCPSHRITQHLKAWYRCCQLAVAKTSLTESFIISNKQITISKANLHWFSGHLNFKLIIFCFPVYLWSVNIFFSSYQSIVSAWKYVEMLILGLDI